jgi:hypothetical protein
MKSLEISLSMETRTVLAAEKKDESLIGMSAHRKMAFYP